MVAGAFQRSGINPRQDMFENTVVHLNDLFNPFYLWYRNKQFKNCEVRDPSLCLFRELVIIGGSTKECQIAIVRDRAPLFGVIVFEHARFYDCDLCNITFLVTKDHYENMNDDWKEYIPVIMLSYVNRRSCVPIASKHMRGAALAPDPTCVPAPGEPTAAGSGCAPVKAGPPDRGERRRVLA